MWQIKNPMKQFSYFEQSAERASRLIEGMPLDQVVLNRLLLFVVRELQERQNRFLTAYGMNSSNFLALAMILTGEKGRINPCDLSDTLMASRTNVTRVVDQLVAAGWVRRTSGENDRRRVHLSVTDQGLSVLEEILPKLWQGTATLWGIFTAEEQAQMNRLLRKLLARLEEGGLADGE